MTNAVTKSVMSCGSFGIYPRGNCRGDELVNVWFCGGRTDGQPRTNHDTVQEICTHRTRREAHECANRPKGERADYQGQQKGRKRWRQKQNDGPE